ncbi:MAG: LytTR family DNA-binding domain-containing protein [Bacteroidetes bacterium]|nr:LytTR family DNA-binding domain-containing protein [Bacteroidota bacterium]
MTQIRCIAIDDEPFALAILADDLRRFPYLELQATFSNAVDADLWLKTHSVDLIFLDIQMPTLTGTQFLRGLSQPPMVIFTTAYEQYALEGFELNVVDYLLKPIPFQRFEKAVLRAKELFELRQKEEAPAVMERGFFFVFSEYKEIKIYFDEVNYVEGLKDYVKIYTTQQPKPILTRLNLKAMEAKLPETQFGRVHNSFIVAFKRITAVQKAKVHLGNVEIPIGNRYLVEFEQNYRKLPSE